MSDEQIEPQPAPWTDSQIGAVKFIAFGCVLAGIPIGYAICLVYVLLLGRFL